MNHFKQRVPNFIDIPPIEFDFDTQEEFYNSDVIKRYLTDEGDELRVERNESPWDEDHSHYVFLVDSMGKRKWLVGYMKHLNGIDIPILKEE